MSEEETKFKQHWRKYKWVYISGAAGVALGVTAGILWSRRTVGAPEIQTKNTVTNVLSYKPSTEINVEVHSRVHPGWIVQDTKTGNVYSSQNEAAKALGVSRSTVSSHLNGKHDTVNGHILERVKKAPLPEA